MKRIIWLVAMVLLFPLQEVQAGLLNDMMIGGAGAGAIVAATGGIKSLQIANAKKAKNPDGSYKEGYYDPNLPHDAQTDTTAPGQGATEGEKELDPDDSILLRSSNTRKLRRGLNAERRSAGLPPNPDNCDAHHMVPKSEKREWAKELADNARQILNDCKIDLDSAENGVYLPGKEDGSSQCEGSYHKTLHTEEYYRSVLKRLTGSRKIGCDAVSDELRAIKDDLMRGMY